MSPGAATPSPTAPAPSSTVSAAPHQPGQSASRIAISSTPPIEVTPMTTTAHQDLHSEHGARKGEHPGRSRNPVIKVHDIAWLEFETPDLTRAPAVPSACGSTPVFGAGSELHPRGTAPGAPCVLIPRGATTRSRGIAFTAQDEAD